MYNYFFFISCGRWPFLLLLLLSLTMLLVRLMLLPLLKLLLLLQNLLGAGSRTRESAKVDRCAKNELHSPLPIPSPPWRNKWSGPGGWIWLTPLTGIGCVHHIEEKDCTARFATGGIREIPDWKINQVDTRRLQPHRRQCTVEGHSNVLSLWVDLSWGRLTGLYQRYAGWIHH